MRKATEYLYLLAVLTMILVPLLKTYTREDQKSPLDNRLLAEAPEINDPEFLTKTEQYLQDRIGGRDRMVTIYQKLYWYLAGSVEHPLYTKGQDGQVFLSMHDNIAYSDYHTVFAEYVCRMKEYCDERDVKFYFMFEPEKSSVYRRYLPVGVNYDDSWVDRLIGELRERGVTCVNNTECLTEKAKTEKVFNTRYDAGHWNDLGAFYGTNSLWAAVGKDFPAVTEYTPDEFTVTETVAQYMPSSRFPVNETVPVFTLNTGWEDVTDQYSGMMLDTQHRFFRVCENRSETAADYPVALIFHGSYYNRKPEFFVGRVSRYIGIHDYGNVLNLDYYLNTFKPDIVVFEAAEYTINDTYFSQSGMAAAAFNPYMNENGELLLDGEPVMKQDFEEFTVESGSALEIIPRQGYDELLLERKIPWARYAYLVSGDTVLDLKRNSAGYYYAGAPHGSVTEDATLYYVDYEDGLYRASIPVINAQQFIGNYGLTDRTTHVSNTADGSQIVFLADEDNELSRIDVMLLNAVTGEYIRTVGQTAAVGRTSGWYRHGDESGWYTVRIKANSSIQDEYVDYLAYLCKGKEYYYSLEPDIFRKNKIVLNRVVFQGACPFVIGSTSVTGEVSMSESVSELRDEEGRVTYDLTTDIPENTFNKAVLQIRNPETSEYYDPLSIADAAGTYSGVYIHDKPDGLYYIKVRANSNKRDEYVEELVELTEGMMYRFYYTVDTLEEKEVVLTRPVLVAFGYRK